MAIQMREPVTISTRCSGYVEAAAVRLFQAGWLGKLHLNEHEDGHYYYSLPSETDPETVYQIDFYPSERTIECSCPAGQHRVPCKHVRLFQLYHGWTGKEAGR